MALNEEQAAQIILIRSVEECDSAAFPGEILTGAIQHAGKDFNGSAWFVKRASYLMERSPARYRSILPLARFSRPCSLPVFLIALAFGFATNLLGPVEKIHLVRNPVALFVAWNLLVYLFLILWLLRKKLFPFGLARFKRKGAGGTDEEEEGGKDGALHAAQHIPCFLGYILPGAWRLLHYGATGLALGATVGMYFRGLFQDYDVVWTSTYIRSEQGVSAIINFVFGPGLFVSRLLGWELEASVQISRLLGPEGDPAGPWIHLFAITVVIVVVIPRAALAAWQGFKIEKLKDRLPLLFNRYYGDILASPIRSLIVREVRESITTLGDEIASYVTTELYDRRISTRLRTFREEGGKISDLGSDINTATESFAPAIGEFITQQAAPQFQQTLSLAIEETFKGIGTEIAGLKTPEKLRERVGGWGTNDSADVIGQGYGDAIGAALTVSVAAALGTLSGGFGKTLGVCIISALLGSSGPIGFLIGAVIGVVAAGAAWHFGKDKITDFVETIDLPAAVIRASLWESRFEKLVEDGRKQCHESVKTQVEEQMNPLVPGIAEEILIQVRRLWKA